MNRIDTSVISTAMLAALSLSPLSAAHAADVACDRVCMVKIADQYLTALVSHQPNQAPLADNVAFNENGSPAQLGTGSWQAAQGIRAQRQLVVDTDTHQIGIMAVMDGKNDEFQELAIRLKIDNAKITEIESLWTQDGHAGPAWAPEILLYREAPFVRDVPEKIRSSRADLTKVINKYWDVATGSHNGYDVPYASDCYRFENGTNVSWEQELSVNQKQQAKDNPIRSALVAHPENGLYWGCARETTLSTSFWNSATDRHYVIDEERGLVMSFVKVDTGAGGTGGMPPATTSTSAAGTGMAAAPQETNPLRTEQIGTVIPGSRRTDAGGPAGMSTKTNHASLRNATIYQAQTNWIVDGKIKRESAFYYITPKTK